MILFKRKRELSRLQNLPALTRFEVCDGLQPFVVQLGLTFTEDEIRFPQPLSYQQFAIYFAASCDRLYVKSIRFSDVIDIDKNSKRTYLVVRTGHVFYFFKDCEIWYVDNPLHNGEPCTIVLWWWALSACIVHRWRKLFCNNPSS